MALNGGLAAAPLKPFLAYFSAFIVLHKAGSYFNFASLTGGTNKCDPTRGVDEKMRRVPTPDYAPLTNRQDGFIRPCVPRDKAWGLCYL